MSRRRTSRAVGLVRALVALAVTLCGWLAMPTSALAAPAQPTLTDDAGGQPLFAGADPLSPGASRSRCITITATQTQDGDQITLGATAAGDLVPWLIVTADAGTGGRPDCQDFAGHAFYQGSLGDLAARPDDGADTGWRPVGTSSRTFRITIDVEGSAAAMGRAAQAAFSWRLVRGTPEAPASTPVPSASAPAGTIVTSPPAPAPVSTSPGTSAESPEPSTAPRPVASVDVPAIGRPVPEAPSPWTARFRQFSDAVGRVIQEPGFTVGPLLLALLFLLTQHLIDMRDPKLAAASRTKREIMLPFPVSYGESMRDPQDRS